MIFVEPTLEECLKLAKSDDQTERMEAAYFLGEVGGDQEEVWTVLKELMHDETLEVRTTANEAIKKLLKKKMEESGEVLEIEEEDNI